MPQPSKGPRLGGSPSHERLILANLATALFEHGRITTTESRAKRLKPVAERLVTIAKKGDLPARRRLQTVIRNKDVVHALIAFRHDLRGTAVNNPLLGRMTKNPRMIREGTAEAELVGWHVKVGDAVEEDQIIADIMTDKATVEITSPVAGTVVAHPCFEPSTRIAIAIARLMLRKSASGG